MAEWRQKRFKFAPCSYTGQQVTMSFRLACLIALCSLPTQALAPPKRVKTPAEPLFLARRWKTPLDEDFAAEEFQVRIASDRPTQTMTETPEPPTVPEKPKIVVLGASGKIGRLVVRQLLDSGVDATIVAFCRDYDKACRVLYDDLLVLKAQPKGPRLQIVEGDLVPPEELPGHFDKEHEDWLDRSSSAARFYGTSIADYDNGADDTSNEALEEAIKGSTCIISCVGSVRPTNLWSDLLARPLLRLLRVDVSSWCADCRHPYYVHFATTRKALALAEREQLRRQTAAADDEADDEAEPIPRIRFIRISDLCVAYQPWHFISVLTNALHSMVFRYQDMAEKILEASPLIETVVLRPGDLVDDERDVNTTSLQVNIDGKVPSPARVGREDVAALVVAAAMFDAQDRDENDRPFHYTLACRWAGRQMDPYPPQGCMSQGLPDAQSAMQTALRNIRRREKRQRRWMQRRKQQESSLENQVMQFARSLPTLRRRVKPYGLCVAVPVYMILTMMAKTLMQTILMSIPGSQKWLTPIAARASSLVGVWGAYLLSRVGAVVRSVPVIPWRRAAQKYISF